MNTAMAIAPPIFRLFSIGFGGAHSTALPMRDLLTEAVIGDSPEWVANHRSAPVAFPQGATVTLEVVFQASNLDQFASGESYRIEATGDLFTVRPKVVPLSIQPLDGFSAPITFSLSAPVPDGIAVRRFTLEWRATGPSGDSFAIGTSSHTLYVTWRRAALGTDLLPPIIPYVSVVRMAVAWCEGQTTAEGICAALIDHVGKAGIARTITSGDVRTALLELAADTETFAALLGQLLLAHGIEAQARAFTIDWSDLPAHALQWVPTATRADTKFLSGVQIHSVSLVPTDSGVLLCDADAGIGPVAFPAAIPPDTSWTLSGDAYIQLRHSYLEPAATTLAAPLAGLTASTPLTLSSIHFAFEGGAAIPLRDPVTDAPIGATAEWVAGIDRVLGADSDAGSFAPAAYVGGTPIVLSVRFRRTLDRQHGGGQTLTTTIGASGTPCGVRPQTVTLTFDMSGQSQPVRFETDGIVCSGVGVTTLSLDWYAQSASGERVQVGESRHPLYFTWKPMIPNAAENLPDWAYAPVVQWTSSFAAGATADKEVCDRVMQQLPATGLKYGVAGWTPRQMLLGQGGMCGGWYQLFQTMLHCQGVFVEKRAFLVDWRTLPANDVQWNAIVVSNGGLNQCVPPVTPSTFHDVGSFPIQGAATLTTSIASRYRFWGAPGGWSDGHCVNFLVSDGQLFLYDASFHLGPIALNMPLPPSDGTVLGGADLADFVAKYLSVAVSHMLGSFTVNGQVYTSEVPVGAAAGINGISVVTSSLPVMQGPTPVVTFRWI